MRVFILLLFTSFLLFSCKSDGSSKDSNISDEPLDMENLSEQVNDANDQQVEEKEIKLDEAISNEALAKKMLKESKSVEVNEVAKVEDRNTTKLTGKSAGEKEKEEKLKLEATKEAIEKSANKGMSCDQMLEDQSKLVDEFAKSKEINLIRELAKKQNDPFFQECMKVDAFAEKVEALQTRLDEIADQ